MNGKKLTAAEREARRQQWWRQRRGEATTPAMQASRAWDQIAADIGRMEPEERAPVWLAVAAAVDQVGVNLTPRQTGRRVAQGTDATRAHTRGAEPNTPRKERV